MSNSPFLGGLEVPTFAEIVDLGYLMSNVRRLLNASGLLPPALAAAPLHNNVTLTALQERFSWFMDLCASPDLFAVCSTAVWTFH